MRNQDEQPDLTFLLVQHHHRKGRSIVGKQVQYTHNLAHPKRLGASLLYFLHAATA